METLHALPLRKGWIYEAVVCTFSGDAPHAAPFGVWTDDHATLELDMYEGSETLANVLAGRELVVAFPSAATTLFEALFAPQRLSFGHAATVRAPTLDDAVATVELVVHDTAPTEGGTHLSALPRRTHLAAEEVTLLNRAEGLLLESLVLATRLERLGAAAVLPALTENLRVVRKVAPGSPAEAALTELLSRRGARP